MNPQTESLKKELEETLEALSRSRAMVKMLQSNKEIGIDQMALTLKRFFNEDKSCSFTDNEEREWWMYEVLRIVTAAY